MDKKQKEYSIDSFSEEKLNASKIIKAQLNEICRYQIPSIALTVGLINDDDIFTWHATLLGANDTPYSNGIFFLKIIFPDNYPKKGPDIIFLTPIYHLNVNPNKLDISGAEKLGHVSVSLINWWTPATTAREMLTKLFTIFYMANPDSCYGIDRANEFRNNRLLYEEKVKCFTRKYANPCNKFSSQGCVKTWDFSLGLNAKNNYNMNESNTNNYNNKEKELKENQTKEKELKENQTKEKELKENQTKEKELKENQTKEEELKENQTKEEELKENQTKENELKENQTKENELKENQTKENEFINLKFIYNGNLTEEITIQCNKNDLIKDLIERYKMKKNINDDLHFFIWHNQKLKPELYVGQAYLRNNDTIVVIDTKDIEYG